MCYLCVNDGQTSRHTNHRFKRFPKTPPPGREHGTYRGCRQHWGRGEPLCSECADHYRSLNTPPETRMGSLHVRLTRPEIVAIQNRAKLNDTTVSDLVRVAIADLLLADEQDHQYPDDSLNNASPLCRT